MKGQQHVFKIETFVTLLLLYYIGIDCYFDQFNASYNINLSPKKKKLTDPKFFYTVVHVRWKYIITTILYI